MSVPAYINGDYFSVAVNVNGDGATFIPLCGLTSRNLDRTLQTSDEYIKDCSDPQSIPWRVINATGQSYDIAGSGVYDRNQADLVDSIFGQSLLYRYFRADDAASHVSSSYVQGMFKLTKNSLTASDGTTVKAALTWASDGVIAIIPAAPAIELDPLGMTPKTVVHGVAYSGTVTGTGNTRTVAGTFAAAGFPVITLTEVLAAAGNTPKVSTVALTVT